MMSLLTVLYRAKIVNFKVMKQTYTNALLYTQLNTTCWMYSLWDLSAPAKKVFNIVIQKESSLIIAKILDDVTIPETTSSRHLFFEAGKKFTKTEALKICSRLKGEVSNTIFHAKPDAFWNCNCVTYPVIETMPNNVLISQHPVEALHCVYDNGKWNAFCLGRKHAVFVPRMDSRQKEIWIFDQNYLFETVYQWKNGKTTYVKRDRLGKWYSGLGYFWQVLETQFFYQKYPKYQLTFAAIWKMSLLN